MSFHERAKSKTVLRKVFGVLPKNKEREKIDEGRKIER